MRTLWRNAEPYLRAIAYLVDESRREDITLLHDRLKRTESDLAHLILQYLLSPPRDGRPIRACPETLHAIHYIVGRLDELSEAELENLARHFEADCTWHVP
ncbi:hypothetical protein AB1L88_16785 [Tautonia sp. JC769]|uniref:hypothetical protein n=1 Tax=Tautonia sp. JC769 TaxID=3232135 RepID=UPI0034577658